MAEDKPTSDTGPKNWRGGAPSSGESEQKYGWQNDSRLTAPLHPRKGSVKRRLRILAFGCVTVFVSAVFLAELLFSQLRTPMIVMAPEAYEFPFPPLSWSQEDLEGFRELDRETLNVQALDAGWKTKDQGLRQFDLQLQNILRQRSLPAAIVLYVRMHSAVDGAGVPCLVPPGANPFNADSWIPVNDVLQRFHSQKIPDSISKLVVLDCGSVLCNWSQGVVFNTFATRLPAIVAEAAVPNLVVINATGPAEVSATSAELQHGVFGYFLELGLAGAADADGGNRDRMVSARELHRYLLRNVNAWSAKNRGRPQQPQIIPSDANDFPIVMVFNPRARNRAKIESRLAASSSVTVSAGELGALWKTLEDCQVLNPLRFGPLEWTSIEQRLHWLEAALESGDAYGRASRRIHQDLKQRVAIVEQSGDESDRDRHALTRWARFTNEPFRRNSAAKMNTAPLAELFDTIGPASAENFKSILAQFKKSPSPSNLRDTVQALSANADLSQFELTCLLQLWQKYQVLRLWPDGELLTSVLELHELAESASVPADERSLEWIRPIIDSADVTRRKIDDQVFFGGNPPVEEISAAQQMYRQASQVAIEIARAYSIRDQVDHELPYLAQWLLRPRFNGQGPTQDFLEFKSQILELMRDQRALERALSSPGVTTHGDSSQLPFQGLLSNVESQHKHLFDQLAIEYERLLQSDDSSATSWNDVHDLLSVPILPPRSERLALSGSQQRNLLREKLTLIDRKLVDHFTASVKESSRSDRQLDQATSTSSEVATAPTPTPRHSHPEQMAAYLDELLIEVPEALALTIVRREQNFEADDPQAAKDAQNQSKKHDIETIAEMQGRLFRQWMRAAPEAVRNDVEQQLTSNENRIFQNSLGEKIARASATLAANRLENDPVALRRNSDLQSLLLWHTRRVMDDFWGRSALEETSFFDSTAGSLMRMAESIGRTTTSSQSEMSELNARLQKYRLAAAGGLTTVSDNLLIADDSETAVAKIAVYQNVKQNCLFPEGHGVVFVESSGGGRLGEAHQLSIPWNVAADSTETATKFTVALTGMNHQSQATALKAITSFRGHDYIGDLTINSIEGIVIDYRPNTLQEARVTIRGRSTRKLSIVFVLDCSNSMSQQIALAGDNRKGARLDVAKLALESMLDKLAEDETHRVGVICFGHRIGGDLKQPGMLLRQTEYNGPIPDQVKPFDDVETILPLGRFNASFDAVVNERLASIKPWGESPLYLALIQALKMFDNDEQDADRCVVVITDGLNYQFNPSATARKSVYDVLSVWNDHRVPVHIVGLGIATDQAAAAQKEFGELAKKTNGSYVSAQEARTLVESLAALQRTSQFQVFGSNGLTVQQADLGQAITLATIPQQPNPFDVTLGKASEHVILRGEESLELIPTRDGRRLDVQPYEVGQPQFIPLVRDDNLNSVTDLVAGIHRPFRRGQKATFEISVQQRERHFVSRPVEVWMEIVPIVRPGQPTPSTYVFYDSQFLPNTTVPVLRWTVSDWPNEAVQAKIRFWCRDDESKPTSIVSLRDAISPARNPDFTVDGVPGVNARISAKQNGSLQVSLVERHSQESLGVGTLKVALKSKLIPSRIRHRFDAENRVATHFFEFPAGSDTVLNDAEFQFTTRAAAQDGALRIADAVIVDVTETGDVHD